MAAKVALTTYLPADSLRRKAIRRRRQLGSGTRIQIKFAPFGIVDGEPARVPTLYIDNVPVAYLANDNGEWFGVNDEPWWGNGLDIQVP